MGKDLWWNKWYIWGLKALEIRLWDYDIRDEILLVNGEAQGVELVMLDKIAQLKSYNNKKKKSLISDFLKYWDRVEIGGKKFFAWLSLSLQY